MKTLRDISRYSSYAPTAGEVLELFELVFAGISRSEALSAFTDNGRTADHFRHVYKSLKDGLLHQAFFEVLPQLEDVKKRRLVCWSKFQRVKQLMIVDERTAAIELAPEVLRLAEKCGFIEVQHSLLRLLHSHYGSIEHDTRRYLRYRKKLRATAQALREEEWAEQVWVQLSFEYKRKKGFEQLQDDIEELRDHPNQQVFFNLLRFSTLSLWYRIHNYTDLVLENSNRALQYFNGRDEDLPYVARWSFYRQLIPNLIVRGDYAEADRHLNQCLELPKEGSQNWHLVMLQRAYLGLYSDKPMITLDAWRRATKNRKHDNPELDERWETIRAYLGIFEKLGRIKTKKPFRLGRYLSSVSETEHEKAGANISIMVVEFVHLLLDKNYTAYMKKAEGIKAYAHKHLRGQANLRYRCMLYMLAKVEEADYYRTRTVLRVHNWEKKLRKTNRNMVTEAEVMPFEKLWQIVLQQLR